MKQTTRIPAHAIILAAAALLACDPTKRAECGDALLEGRSLASRGEIDRAREHLAQAKNVCPAQREAYIEELADHIERKDQAKRQEAARKKASEERAKQEPLREFVEWIVTRIDAPEKMEDRAHCFERTHPDRGWCEATHQATSGRAMVVRYWKSDPAAHRFSVRVDAPATCEDVGEHRVVRRWTVKVADAGQTARTHCEFLSQRLRGRKALIAESKGSTEVHVFSSPYLDRDSELSKVVEREGR